MTENKVLDKPKVKFNNGWTHELEVLAADWADKSQCYRWMHDKSSQELGKYNQHMMIPVIILSTLSGAGNFALNTIFPDPTSSSKTVATLAIGGISIITGIISTLANFFRYAQLSESHSVAAISWAKFARLIIIELALHPNERTDAFTFLKMFRVELDRLIEQSPIIPEFIIKRFQKEFDTKLDVKRPDITGDIKHTTVYDNHNERLKLLASEAALSLMHKKKLMKDLVMVDIDRHINNAIENRPYTVLPHRRVSIQSSNIYIPEQTTNRSNKPTVSKQPQSFIPKTVLSNNDEINPNSKPLVSQLKQIFNKKNIIEKELKNIDIDKEKEPKEKDKEIESEKEKEPKNTDKEEEVIVSEISKNENNIKSDLEVVIHESEIPNSIKNE